MCGPRWAQQRGSNWRSAGPHLHHRAIRMPGGSPRCSRTVRVCGDSLSQLLQPGAGWWHELGVHRAVLGDRARRRFELNQAIGPDYPAASKRKRRAVSPGAVLSSTVKAGLCTSNDRAAPALSVDRFAQVVAGVPARILLQIVLVIALGWREFGRRAHLGDNRCAPLSARIHSANHLLRE